MQEFAYGGQRECKYIATVGLEPGIYPFIDLPN